MARPPVSSCEVKVSEDKKTVVYCLRLDTGHAIQKKFDEYEKFYSRISHLLPASFPTPPKKKLFVSESRLQDKRKNWILSMSQYVLDPQHTSPSEDIREFYCLPHDDERDENYVDLGAKEVRGATPNDFKPITTIGRGSFGRVFQVKHLATGKIYAMKVLEKEHIRKKNEVKHVMAELSVLKSNINHPFLVSLHFSFQNKDKLYFILDHLNGGELFTHLQNEKSFGESRSRFYAADIASAIGYLHDNNIIYRDLKPENLLLDRKGYIVLTDFGLCKEGIGPKDTTSTFCGTPEYLAPEIILRKPYDRTVDWWCLGSVLYEMMFGLPPYYSKDHNEMYDRIVNQPLKFKHSASQASTDIITQLLQKDPKKRLGSRNDFRDIKNHAFFLPIDWDKLLRREITAQYLPKIKNEEDVTHISSNFVQERFDPESLVPTNRLTTQRDHDFEDFTYIQKPNFLTK